MIVRNRSIDAGWKCNQGLSLLELTCALFIVTVGLFGAIHMYLVAMDKTKVINEKASAQRVLRNEIETWRAQPYDRLNDGTDLPFLSQSPELEQLANAAGSVAIQETVPVTPGLKQVQVSLKWQSEHGRWIEDTLTTLIADKGEHP